MVFCPVCSKKTLGIMPSHVLMEELLTCCGDVVANLFRQAHVGVTVEVGYRLTADHRHTRPDITVTDLNSEQRTIGAQLPMALQQQ